jgi:peroxiredoxin
MRLGKTPWFGFTACALLSTALAAQSLPRFALRDTEGALHHQDEWSNKQAIVIFFTTTDCPLSNSYVPEMNRIQKDYSTRGVEFYAVQTDTTVAATEVQRHARDFGFAFPVLLDERQVLVRLTGATTTPEVAVLSSSGKVLYLGRIDNRIVDYDKRRTVVTEFDLRNALDAVINGKQVPRARTNVVGCIINYVSEEKRP